MTYTQKSSNKSNTTRKLQKGGAGEQLQQQPQPIPLGQIMIQPPIVQQQAQQPEQLPPGLEQSPNLGVQPPVPPIEPGQENNIMINQEPQMGDGQEPQMGDGQEPQLGQGEELQMGDGQEPQSGYTSADVEAIIEETPKTPVSELLPDKPMEESAELAEFRKLMEDHENKRDFFYINSNISTELNKDKTYKREGLLHFTDSVGINALRSGLTAIGSLFGSKGIENVIYDKLRNTALQKVGILLGEDRRCYNTRMDFERFNDTLFLHIYGTIYVKK